MVITYDILKSAQRAADNTKHCKERFAILMLIKLGLEQLQMQNDTEIDIVYKNMSVEEVL